MGIPDLALQYRETFERVTKYELSALMLLTESGSQVRAQNLQCNNIEEFEDMNAYPLDPSLTDLGVDHFAFLDGADDELLYSVLGHGEEYLGNNFEGSIEQFACSNIQSEGHVE